jgi:hypothetical protein
MAVVMCVGAFAVSAHAVDPLPLYLGFYDGLTTDSAGCVACPRTQMRMIYLPPPTAHTAHKRIRTSATNTAVVMLLIRRACCIVSVLKPCALFLLTWV